MALTVKQVAKLMRRGEPGRYLDSGVAGVRGLYLEVGGRTNAHWVLRYQLAHRTRWMGLGPARIIGLDQARARAKIERAKLVDKLDPLAIRRAERAKAAAAPEMLTFTQAAERFHAAHERGWSREHAEQFISSLKQYVFPCFGRHSVGELTMAHVIAMLEQPVAAHKGNPAGTFWAARTVTASRVRNRVELVLDWAAARGYRPQGSPNPAAWGILQHALAKPTQIARVVHHRALPFLELPRLLQQLATHEGSGVKALMFTILTAARAGETLGAVWDEISFENATWMVPAERMKSRRPHRVPLAPPVIELLNGLPREANNSFLFIGSRPGSGLSESALAAALKRVGCDATVHGFRSSFSDWAHERSNHSNLEIELSLAHASGSAAERSYRRGDMLDRRRKLMTAWGQFCCSPPAAGAVVPLRKVTV